jgi:SAM-dependent methyltransferase
MGVFSGGRCLGCGTPLPEAFLNLGKTPLANAYVRPQRLHLPEKVFPLAVAYCVICHLVQLTDLVPPEEMFSEYLYFSSYSDSYLAHARDMANSLIERFQLRPKCCVMEVASNDGYLLQYFLMRGIPVLGVEPAKNIAKVAEQRGVPTLNCFFGPETVAGIVRDFGLMDLIIGNNVLAHVPTINNFLGAVRSCLKPRGAAIFEFPYVKELLDRNEFDTIYHEHVFYFSLTAIKNLAERAGLEVLDVSCQTVHGGSLRVFLQHKGTHSVTSNVQAILDEEEAVGMLRSERYASFSKNVVALTEELRTVLHSLKVLGKRLAGYGAPAKGNTLLNYCGIGSDLLDFTVDRSPYKQGLYLPGTHIPIEPPEQLRIKRPDYVLILPWNLKDEIMQQIAFIREWGGRFVVPIPSVKLLP